MRPGAFAGAARSKLSERAKKATRSPLGAAGMARKQTGTAAGPHPAKIGNGLASRRRLWQLRPVKLYDRRMTDRPKIPPGFRDATKEGAAIAVIGDIGRRIGDADKLVAEAGGPRASQSEERRTPAEMSTQTASTATDASGATPPSAPAKPMLRPPKGGTDRTAEAVGKAVAFVGAEAFRPLK